MTPGVAVWRCARCRAALFPQRLLCPRRERPRDRATK
jgi:hypothetical protein